MSNSTRQKWDGALTAPNADLPKLRDMAWTGVPRTWRAQTWQLLLGYLPTNLPRREATLARKRGAYAEAVAQFHDVDEENGPQDSRRQRELVKRDSERELEPDSRAGYEEGGDNRSGSGSDSDGYKNHFDNNDDASSQQDAAIEGNGAKE